MSKFLLLILCWIVYFFLHSLLADDAVKQFSAQKLGKYYRYYRIFYNTLSGIGLLFILLLNASIPSDTLFESTQVNRYLGLVLATFGIVVLKAAFKQYSMKGFLGLRSDEEDAFRADGILKHVRHPIYSATILIVVGYCLFVPVVASLVSAACIFMYLPIGIWLEERKLMKRFGNTYREYCNRTPALIPTWRGKR